MMMMMITTMMLSMMMIEGDYCMLLGPVMNGTYDKYMERMYRDKVGHLPPH